MWAKEGKIWNRCGGKKEVEMQKKERKEQKQENKRKKKQKKKQKELR